VEVELLAKRNSAKRKWNFRDSELSETEVGLLAKRNSANRKWNFRKMGLSQNGTFEKEKFRFGMEKFRFPAKVPF